VLAGDIGEPNLGLDEATWKRLAQRVDLIVHPAAHVNHVLPYNQLFGANVVGTAELIRLAITTTMKPVTYISTVAATFVLDDVIDEGADMRIASPVRKLEDTYANGYATSKWAGEVVLREAHDLCDLPVAVFRCDMILVHSRYAGQLNVIRPTTTACPSISSPRPSPSYGRKPPNGSTPTTSSTRTMTASHWIRL
jgi:fatty acid CoA ligase FadD9